MLAQVSGTFRSSHQGSVLKVWRDRHCVSAHFDGFRIHIRGVRDADATLGLCDWNGTVSYIAAQLRREDPNYLYNHHRHRHRAGWDVEEWKRKQSLKQWLGPMRSWFNHIRERAHPLVLKMHKAWYNITGPAYGMRTTPDMWRAYYAPRYRYLRNDTLFYRRALLPPFMRDRGMNAEGLFWDQLWLDDERTRAILDELVVS